ncbi:MAG: hypothetical protein QNK54_01535 [Candidatus Planktophila sp.]
MGGYLSASSAFVNFFVEGDGFEGALLFFGAGTADGVTTLLLSFVLG